MFQRYILISILVAISSALPVYIFQNMTNAADSLDKTDIKQSNFLSIVEEHSGIVRNLTTDGNEDILNPDCEMDETSTIGASNGALKSVGLPQQAANAGACECIGPIGWICIIILIAAIILLAIALYARSTTTSKNTPPTAVENEEKEDFGIVGDVF